MHEALTLRGRESTVSVHNINIQYISNKPYMFIHICIVSSYIMFVYLVMSCLFAAHLICSVFVSSACEGNLMS